MILVLAHQSLYSDSKIRTFRPHCLQVRKHLLLRLPRVKWFDPINQLTQAQQGLKHSGQMVFCQLQQLVKTFFPIHHILVDMPMQKMKRQKQE